VTEVFAVTKLPTRLLPCLERLPERLLRLEQAPAIETRGRSRVGDCGDNAVAESFVANPEVNSSHCLAASRVCLVEPCRVDD
jgi:hypothetical protein